MILALGIFLGILSIVNKILLFLNKKSGWISGMAIGLISGTYFWMIGLKILAVTEFGFFLVMLYGYIISILPTKQISFYINTVISFISILLLFALFTGSLTIIETIASLSFIWGGYQLATSRRLSGWLLFLVAHISTMTVTFYSQQFIFAGLQVGSALVCIYALFSISANESSYIDKSSNIVPHP